MKRDHPDQWTPSELERTAETIERMVGSPEPGNPMTALRARWAAELERQRSIALTQDCDSEPSRKVFNQARGKIELLEQLLAADPMGTIKRLITQAEE